MSRPQLRVVRGARQGAPAPQRCFDASLWKAWRSLSDWECRCASELGDQLDDVLLLLWAVSRLGGNPESDGLLRELIDDDMTPRFGDVFTRDMVVMAFALGGAWVAAHPAYAAR